MRPTTVAAPEVDQLIDRPDKTVTKRNNIGKCKLSQLLVIPVEEMGKSHWLCVSSGLIRSHRGSGDKFMIDKRFTINAANECTSTLLSTRSRVKRSRLVNSENELDKVCQVGSQKLVRELIKVLNTTRSWNQSQQSSTRLLINRNVEVFTFPGAFTVSSRYSVHSTKILTATIGKDCRRSSNRNRCRTLPNLTSAK